MKQQLPIKKTVFDKNAFNALVNREFSQLIDLNPSTTDSNVFSVEDFFNLYEQLFFDIPKNDETNSHQYLVNKSSEYLGIKNQNDIDVQLLQDEITSLREQLLSANESLEQFKIVTANNPV